MGEGPPEPTGLEANTILKELEQTEVTFGLMDGYLYYLKVQTNLKFLQGLVQLFTPEARLLQP